MRPYRHSLLELLSILCVTLPLYSKGETQTAAKRKPSNFSISAVLVFGDSTVDPGNNDFTGTLFKSNFPPYGRDFPDHIPTGRFTNGRLVTDYCVSYLGIKEYLPPYLDSTLSTEELMTGVSFASAASGFDPLTAQISGVISLPEQLEFFREYKARLELAVGSKRTQNQIKKAVFLISAGTNDFVINYFGLPVRPKSYSVSSYQQFLIENLQQLVQELWKEGARVIAVVGLPPMGCLPLVITVNSDDLRHGRGCIESLSSVARDYNKMLQNKLKSMQYGGLKIFYGDIYTPLVDIIQGRKFGFEVVNRGCCGTGFLEAAYLCNVKSAVCPNPSKYVFWDSIHPTERAYYAIFQSLRPTIDFFLNG